MCGVGRLVWMFSHFCSTS